ncbi:MAG: PilZ domain-containing protein, partial [Myxococcota bacterium]
ATLGSDPPFAVVRTVVEQFERGMSSEAPVVAIWDPSISDGGGDPFSHGLTRHVVSPRALEDSWYLERWIRPLAESRLIARTDIAPRSSESYQTELNDPAGRPFVEAAVVNDLNRLDADGHTSARVIKTLVAMTSLFDDDGANLASLSWPTKLRFGSDARTIWLSLECARGLDADAVVGELSHGYHGVFRKRARSQIPGLGWFFAARQVDGLFINLAADSTELLAIWEREGGSWNWQPNLHIFSSPRRPWRRARRHSVRWAAELRQANGEYRASGMSVNVSARGALIRATGDAADFTVNAPIDVWFRPEGEGKDDADALFRTPAMVRDVRTGLGLEVAVEFQNSQTTLGQALERLSLNV